MFINDYEKSAYSFMKMNSNHSGNDANSKLMQSIKQKKPKGHPMKKLKKRL